MCLHVRALQKGPHIFFEKIEKRLAFFFELCYIIKVAERKGGKIILLSSVGRACGC